VTARAAVDGIALWDDAGPPPDGGITVYRWSGYAEGPRVRSLLRYVDAHAPRLRAKYIAWTHDLGESRVRGRRLIDHLAWRDDLSFWWLTTFVERSPWKSPAIIDAIRLLAFEEILVEQKPAALSLVSANRQLHEVLVDVCRRLGIAYQWTRISAQQTRRRQARDVYAALPPSLRAVLSAVQQIARRWPFSRASQAAWFEGEQSVLLCSYFIHLHRRAADEGHFESGFWDGLPALLHGAGRPTNWLQLFVPSDAATPAVAMKWVGRFNLRSTDEGAHRFIDSYLSPRLVARVAVDWLRLLAVSWRLRGVRTAFRPAGSHVSLWPVMRRDWRAALRGPEAFANLLWMALFDAAMRSLPRQAVGLYLHENQGWERAFIHAWRKYGHGRLIGVAHSTVRFWDIRYFADPRGWRSPGELPMPQPDQLALNGPAALDACVGSGIPSGVIIECEALRYNYLSDRTPPDPRRRQASDAIRVLVLGDFAPAGTSAMLQLLAGAVPRMARRLAVTVKPHPSHMVDASAYPSLNLEVVTDSLGSALSGCDVVLSGNLTSAAVDAYLAGLPVIVTLEDTQLNFSPLRGREGVRFVASAEELADALEAAASPTAPAAEPAGFFVLDRALPRWRRTLAC
jgi:surface carbohydrate biosynthesis protein (TIGR04326 family)